MASSPARATGSAAAVDALEAEPVSVLYTHTVPSNASVGDNQRYNHLLAKAQRGLGSLSAPYGAAWDDAALKLAETASSIVFEVVNYKYARPTAADGKVRGPSDGRASDIAFGPDRTNYGEWLKGHPEAHAKRQVEWESAMLGINRADDNRLLRACVRLIELGCIMRGNSSLETKNHAHTESEGLLADLLKKRIADYGTMPEPEPPRPNRLAAAITWMASGIAQVRQLVR